MEEGVPTSPDCDRAGDRAPRWLAITALVLSVVVLVVGGVVVATLLRGRAATTSGDARIQILEQAVDARPEDVTSRRVLAFAYQQAGLNKQALKQYEEVLESEPEDQGALYNSGLLYLAAGKDRKGQERLTKLLRLAPSHTLAAKALAQSYAENEEYERVIDVALPAANAHPELADLQYLAGLGLERTGDAIAAKKRYERALKLVPEMSEAQAGLKRVEGAQ